MSCYLCEYCHATISWIDPNPMPIRDCDWIKDGIVHRFCSNVCKQAYMKRIKTGTWVRLVVSADAPTYDEARSRILRGDWDDEKQYDIEPFEP